MWELHFKGKGVVNHTGGILKFKLVVILINIEHIKNFSVDIEIIIVFFVANVKCFSFISTFNVVLREMVLGPVLEGLKDLNILFLVGAVLSTMRIWLMGICWDITEWSGFVASEKRP